MTKTGLALETFKVNAPLSFVVVPFVVPFSITEAKGKGLPFSVVTVPVT